VNYESQLITIPFAMTGFMVLIWTHLATAKVLDRQEGNALHSNTGLSLHMLGFSPGFLYLWWSKTLCWSIRVRRVPQCKSAAGSVGIGGNQTGIYPQETTRWAWQILLVRNAH